VRTLLTMVGKGTVEAGWTKVPGALAINEAALSPGIEEAEGELRRFELLPRVTSHVRHRMK